jgi:hypothetical protein
MKTSHHLDFLLAILVAIVIVVLSFLAYNRIIILNYLIGPYHFSHWLSIIGTIYIAIATPVFILKRSFQIKWVV